jgi:hypothetical protein
MGIRSKAIIDKLIAITNNRRTIIALAGLEVFDSTTTVF